MHESHFIVRKHEENHNGETSPPPISEVTLCKACEI